MNLHPSQLREVREILIAANCGDAAPEQFRRLDELIVGQPELAEYAARVVEQQAALAWQGVSRETPAGSLPAAGRTDRRVTRRGEAIAPARRNARDSARGATWSVLAATVAFVVGTAAATLYWSSDRAGHVASSAGKPPSGEGHSAYEARLVRSTACLWDSSSTESRQIGSWLTSGESLDLLEGLAGINLTWGAGGNASISLEGPAAMMLSAEGMPALRFGKLTAAISARRPFVLETPVGRLVIEDYGSIGVSAYGNDAEIHVFDGSASLESAWLAPAGRSATPLRIEAGEAVRVHADDRGELAVERHAAEPAYFVAQVSMNSDPLIVSPRYVAAIKAAKPIGYWRMERESWPEAPNEMGSRFTCQVNGSLGRVGDLGNQALDFGVTDQGGDVLCNEVLDETIGDSYSLELWIKPSHYHTGAVVSLIGDPETPTSVIPHGMLLEMGGSGQIPTAGHHPGRIRFLHRSPATNDPDVGTSCYSAAPYILRKWQHVVAVKDGPAMRLYVNGELVGEGEDSNNLPAGLRLLVGQLYPSRGARPYIGQLDELALYGRALRPEEIAKHYHIIRPKVARKTSI